MGTFIFGSGFGLYGYLPCLIDKFSETVILLQRQRKVLENRTELTKYINLVQWVNSIDEALELCDSVVIAVPPKEQITLIEKCLKNNNIKKYYLEKPIAPNPDLGLKAIASIHASECDLSVGFIFDNLEIFCHEQFRVENTASSDAVNLTWLFRANHFTNNLSTWKRRHSDGGGVLRFYGIHLIALLSRYGYTLTVSSNLTGGKDQPEKWEATFAGEGLRHLNVVIDSNSSDQVFKLCSEQSEIFSLPSPFYFIDSSSPHDSRIEPLFRVIKENFSNKKLTYQMLIESTKFWKNIEEKTYFRSFNV